MTAVQLVAQRSYPRSYLVQTQTTPPITLGTIIRNGDPADTWTAHFPSGIEYRHANQQEAIRSLAFAYNQQQVTKAVLLADALNPEDNTR